ncbi:UNVERIFIED_CONTAM: hypothetical protein K2H54_047217 [Gekko kuhli]
MSGSLAAEETVEEGRGHARLSGSKSNGGDKIPGSGNNALPNLRFQNLLLASAAPRKSLSPNSFWLQPPPVAPTPAYSSPLGL